MGQEDKVLFFCGDDAAWGILMVGEGAEASFHAWNNDGFTTKLQGSFTEIVERGLSRGFSDTWGLQESADAGQVAARIAQDAPRRKTFSVDVLERERLDAAGYQAYLGRQWKKPEFDKVMKAFGRKERAKSLGEDERGQAVVEACRDLGALDAKQAKAVMTALRCRKKTKAALAEHSRVGAEPVWRVVLKLTCLPGPIPAPKLGDDQLVARGLHEIDELEVFQDEAIHPDLIRYTLELHVPFLDCQVTPFRGRKEKEATATLLLTESQAQGLEEGRQFDSYALPQLPGRP